MKLVRMFWLTRDKLTGLIAMLTFVRSLWLRFGFLPNQENQFVEHPIDRADES